MAELLTIAFVMAVAAAFYNLGRWHEKKAQAPVMRALERHNQALADDVANKDRDMRPASRCVLMFANDMAEHIETKRLH